jgi:hypothetical protein
MLAYVFWHWPGPEVDLVRYAERLAAFHRALRAAPPEGFVGSRVREVCEAPWVPAPQAFEDWYLVEDFAALGALERAAVTGTRRAPHDDAARLARGGTAGLYGRVREGAADPIRAAWFAKPAGTPYPDFLARVPPAELWQRKLTLGPAPEFCLSGGTPPEGAEGAITLQVKPLPVD